MSASRPPKVQVIVTGRFITLFLLALSLLGGGYHWYSQQRDAQERLRQTQERFKIPPYFINRGATIIRTCGRCLDLGRLKPQPEWKVEAATEIPATEQRWFLAVEDPPMPVTVSGVLMLPVHPAYQENPSFGFDQTRVMLVLYQNLQRMPGIEQLPPPPPTAVSEAPQTESPSTNPPLPVEAAGSVSSASRDASGGSADEALGPNQSFSGEWRNADPNTQSVTKIVISGNDGLELQAWGRCYPSDCDWGLVTDIPKPTSRRFAVFWDHGFAENRLELSLQHTSQLRAVLKTHFKDNSGRQDSEATLFFTKAAVP